MRKPLILISITIITIGAIYALARYIKMDGLSFAWALNFLLMLCVFAFTESLKSQLTSSYYNEKEWEQRGKIYERVGIKFFRKLLVWIGWEKLNKKANPIEKNTQTLMNLHYQTKKSELGHVIVFFIVLGFNVFVAFKFGILKALWLLILNVLLNLYPIFLQRYNRPRIQRAINLSKRR
jgi:predicted outer membrane lipoprotein